MDSVDPAVRWATIPASPLLVDSLERVTRVARWHVSAPLFGVYPPSIDVGSLSTGQRALISQVDFLRYDGRSLFVVEPPRLDDVERLLRSRDFASFHHNVKAADLQRASRLFDDLLRCPVYPTHGTSSTQFRPREKGAWLCRCASCRSEWGLSTCGACGYRIPFVKPGVPVAGGERPTDFFGGDLLASLCEGAPAADVMPVDGGPDGRVLICPQCRACGRSDKYPACERCAVRPLTVNEPQARPRVR